MVINGFTAKGLVGVAGTSQDVLIAAGVPET